MDANIDWNRVTGAVRSLVSLRDTIATDLGDPDRYGRYRCPFHGSDEPGQTPTLLISPDGAHFACDVCRARGDVLDYTKARRKVGLKAAVRLLMPSLVLNDFVRPASDRRSTARPKSNVQQRRKSPKPSTPKPALHEHNADRRESRSGRAKSKPPRPTAGQESSPPTSRRHRTAADPMRPRPARTIRQGWNWRKYVYAQALLSSGLPSQAAWSEAKAKIQQCRDADDPDREWATLARDPVVASEIAIASGKASGRA